MTNYRLGCLMVVDAKKDQWFAQIVEEGAPARGFFKPVASGLGTGKQETLMKVCGFAGLKEPPPLAMRSERVTADVVQIGLLDAMRRCARAMDDLTTDIALARHDFETSGVDQYEFDL